MSASGQKRTCLDHSRPGRVAILRLEQRESQVHHVGDRPNEKGRTGTTASIQAVLEHAVNSKRLSGDIFEGYMTRLEELKADFSAHGASFDELLDFRHAELAHSLHRHSKPTRLLLFTPLWEMAHLPTSHTAPTADISYPWIIAGLPRFGRLPTWGKVFCGGCRRLESRSPSALTVCTGRIPTSHPWPSVRTASGSR